MVIPSEARNLLFQGVCVAAGFHTSSKVEPDSHF